MSINNPRAFAAMLLCACLASFAIGLSLPLTKPRMALVDGAGAIITPSLSPAACVALLADYPAAMDRACK